MGALIFYEQQNIGKAKYVVNWHDGVQKHNDGSDFFDIRIFSNKVKKDRFIRALKSNGFKERGTGL
jgi:hypothetical protein